MNKAYKYTLSSGEKKEITFDVGVQRLAITNANGTDGGGGGGGVSYDIDEQDTGLTWINGKKIYQQSFTISNIGSISVYTVGYLSKDTTDEIVSIKGIAISTGGYGSYPLPFVSPSGANYNISIYVEHPLSSQDFRIACKPMSSDYGGFKVIITVQYTKKEE